VEVSLEKFFEQPTVRGLGELIDTVIGLSKDSQHLHNAALDRIE
jgi:hypothetical protein